MSVLGILWQWIKMCMFLAYEPEWIFNIILKKWSRYIPWSYLLQRCMSSLRVLSQGPSLYYIWGENPKRMERDLAILFHNTIRFLFWFGRDWSRQDRCCFVLACKEYQQSAWAGLGLHSTSFISINLRVILVKVWGLWGHWKSTLKPQPRYIPAGLAPRVEFLNFCPALSPIYT